MDKKVLASVAEDIVLKVAAANNVPEAEARTLVGGLLRRITDQIVDKLKPAELTLS